MRANTSSDRDSIDPAENFLQVLDQFAALRSYAGAQPTIGGYRVLASAKPQRAANWMERLADRLGGTPSWLLERFRDAAPVTAERLEPAISAIRERIVLHGSAIASLAVAGGGRLRTSGFLSVLLIGGLAVAVLSGPSSCACSTPFEQADLDRMDYIQNAAFIDTRDSGAAPPYPPASPDDLAFLASDRPLKEREPTVTASLAQGIDATDREPAAAPTTQARHAEAAAPQSTAAIADVTSAQSTPAAADALPEAPLTVAALADSHDDSAGSDHAAASENNADAAAERKSRRDTSAKSDDDDDDRRHARSSRKRGAIRAYRTPVHQVKRQRKKKVTNAHLAQRAPAWAQQMYATTWHSQAFSYNR
ncbi:hypothetical protein [Hyphomicrobium sulfonivorans]|uniref:hypothetical protein n=1 Tax=Hyphomicrobium sulfonivorans TaxID=121290 RepID=UPI00156EEA50|nr:hypothetical protein [Hyphomicrobium sulfonivorans]MBI1650162.1 hypothetical protein [Hyphomicrobium sulfonivorans]NSL73078.1 hypothetical protein [Hyphomicrobium sulfonivorans]